MPLLAAAVAMLVAGLAAVVTPHYLRGVRRELVRTEELREVARSLGLDFASVDPAYPGSTALRLPFELFSRGVEQICENVMTGSIGGRPVVVMDFLYRDRLDDDGTPEDDLLSEPIRHTCAVTRADGRRPHVVIEPASATPVARADGEPVRLEWGDFNTRYRVISLDRGFAPAILDLELMAWLVDLAPRLPLTWEMQRDQILCRAPSLAPHDVGAMVGALSEFARRIGPGASD